MLQTDLSKVKCVQLHDENCSDQEQFGSTSALNACNWQLKIRSEGKVFSKGRGLFQRRGSAEKTYIGNVMQRNKRCQDMLNS